MAGQEIEVLDPVVSATLFRTNDPAEMVVRSVELATVLAEVLRQQRLVVQIGASEHVRVEGWTLLGSMLGVFPVVEWTRPFMDGDTQIGWEARVEARTRNGEVVGAGEAECLRSEKAWRARDDYALRSMAQTRAISKAMRGPLGFVMQLSGFNPTPAEEMPNGQTQPEPKRWEGEFPPPDDVEIPKAKTISKDQVGRMFAIATNGRVTYERVHEIMVEQAGVEHSNEIPVAIYDHIISLIQAEASAPSFAARAAEAQAKRDAGP